MLFLCFHQRKDVKEAEKETWGGKEGKGTALKTCWGTLNPHQTWFSLPWAGLLWGRVCVSASYHRGLELHILEEGRLCKGFEVAFSLRKKFVPPTRVCAHTPQDSTPPPPRYNRRACRSNSSDGRGPTDLRARTADWKTPRAQRLHWVWLSVISWED